MHRGPLFAASVLLAVPVATGEPVPVRSNPVPSGHVQQRSVGRDHQPPNQRTAAQVARPAAFAGVGVPASHQAVPSIDSAVLDRSGPGSGRLVSGAGSGPVRYRKPIEAPISDPFRPPSHRYGPGNRGVELATAPGQVVLTMAEGEVTFAGQVGGTLHVVVLHADGIRTSYSFLAQILVARGQRVLAGAPVGLTASRVHVGARRGDVYIDPARLWSARRGAHLVPDDPGTPLGRNQGIR